MEIILTTLAAGIIIAIFWSFIFIIDELFLGSIIMDFWISFIDKLIEIIASLIRKIKGE